MRRRVPDVRHCPAGRLLAAHHGLVAVGRTAGALPAHRLPEPYEVVVRAAYPDGLDRVSGRRPGVLDRGAGRGDPLDERRERIERAGAGTRRAAGRNRRRIDELHDYVGRQQLLALAHGQIGRGISRAQRHRLDLHRAVRRALRVDGRPDRLHPVLRGAVAFAGVLQRASRTARRVAGGRLELHRGRQRNGRGPARLEDDRQEMAGCAHRHQQGQARRRDRCAVHVPGSVARCARADRGHLRGVGAAQGAAGNEVHARRCRGTARPARAAALRHRRGRARAGRHQLAAHLARRAHRRLDAGLHAPSHRQSQRHYGVPDRAHGRAPARRGACGS